MNQKITFPELIELLAHKQRCSKREAENFLRELMTTMTDVVSSGESLRINTLGTFKPVWVEDRVSVNVQTGEPYTIPGHYKLTFTPVKAVREAVNEPFSCFVVETLPDDAPCVDVPQNSDEIEVDSVDDDTEDVVEVPEVPATDEDAEPTVVEEEIPQTALVVVPEIFDETELKRDAVVEEEDNELSDESVDVPQLEVVETAEVEQSEQEVEQFEPEVEQPEQLPEQLPEQEPEQASDAPIECVDEARVEEKDVDNFDESVKKAYRKGLLIGVVVAVALVGLLGVGVYLYHKFAVSHVEVPVVHNPMVADSSNILVDTVPTIVVEDSVDTVLYNGDVDMVDAAVAPVVTDTVKRGVFLTNISLRHYGHKAFWVYIYEENKNIISNPDNVAAGTVVVIPPAHKYGIDATDTMAINMALDIADKIKRDKAKR